MSFRRRKINGSSIILASKVLRSESGYALASILMLVTILTCVAASILTLQFLQRKEALLDVARVKAMYAAENGLVHALASCQTSSDLPTYSGSVRDVNLPDGSTAHVELTPWGLFLLAKSEGRFRTSISRRIALIAERPSEPFQKALVFANASHQLVFAGNSSIRGNVLLGQPGATTGSLRGRSPPQWMPIIGTVQKEVSPTLPAFRREILRNQFFQLRTAGERSISVAPGVLNLSGVADSIEQMFIQGNATITGEVVRRERPLWIIVDGDVVIASGAGMRGLVGVRAAGRVTVQTTVQLEHGLIISEQSVRLAGSKECVAQVMAPLLHVDSGVVLRYPSAVVSVGVDRPGGAQEIVIHGGATVEGIVALFGDGGRDPRVVTVERSAVVVGTAYADGNMTLDGSVIGTVLTREFAFYEAPTQYYGWLRSAVIDRTSLPQAYLIPPGFTHNVRLDILDWL